MPDNLYPRDESDDDNDQCEGEDDGNGAHGGMVPVLVEMRFRDVLGDAARCDRLGYLGVTHRRQGNPFRLLQCAIRVFFLWKTNPRGSGRAVLYR